jgi:hypothetical protein
MDFNALSGDHYLLENVGFCQPGSQENQIKIGPEVLAISVVQAGKALNNIACNPDWFYMIQLGWL